MASRLLLLRAPPLSHSLTRLTLVSILAAPLLLRPQLSPLFGPYSGAAYRMEEAGRPLSASEPAASYSRRARNPVVREDGRLNPRIFRQVSLGSLLGLGAGIAISLFSKPLAMLIGLLVLAAQALESRGIRVIPYDRIRGAVKGVSVTDAVRDDVALKLSFGVTCALASFGSF